MNTQNPIIAVIDCETCDLSGGVIEFALSKFPDISSLKEAKLGEYEVYSERFKNPIPIHPEAYKVHGISEESLRGKSLYRNFDFYRRLFKNSEAYYQREDMKAGVILIGHNIIAFDLPRMELLTHSCVDTLNLTKQLLKAGVLTHDKAEEGSPKVGNSLDILCSMYCSSERTHLQQYHTAPADVVKTITYLQFLLRNTPLGWATLGELVFLSSTYPKDGLFNDKPIGKTAYANMQQALLKALMKR